jgi:hypothetical protein
LENGHERSPALGTHGCAHLHGQTTRYTAKTIIPLEEQQRL